LILKEEGFIFYKLYHLKITGGYMNRGIKLSFLIFLLILPRQILTQNKNTIRSAVDALASEFTNTWNHDDSTTLYSILADDVLMIGDGLTLQGKEDVFEKWGKPQMKITGDLLLMPVSFGMNSDLAYQTGKWKLQVILTGKEPFISTGSHTFIWRKFFNGWKVASMMIMNDPG